MSVGKRNAPEVDWTAQVTQLLALSGLPLPSLDETARQLHVSGRSLRRYLAEQGGCYQRLLDQERRQRALRCLQDGKTSIAELAFEMGFSDPSNFRRAFKRWTGKGPGCYRE